MAFPGFIDLESISPREQHSTAPSKGISAIPEGLLNAPKAILNSAANVFSRLFKPSRSQNTVAQPTRIFSDKALEQIETIKYLYRLFSPVADKSLNDGTNNSRLESTTPITTDVDALADFEPSEEEFNEQLAHDAYHEFLNPNTFSGDDEYSKLVRDQAMIERKSYQKELLELEELLKSSTEQGLLNVDIPTEAYEKLLLSEKDVSKPAQTQSIKTVSIKTQTTRASDQRDRIIIPTIYKTAAQQTITARTRAKPSTPSRTAQRTAPAKRTATKTATTATRARIAAPKKLTASNVSDRTTAKAARSSKPVTSQLPETKKIAKTNTVAQRTLAPSRTTVKTEKPPVRSLSGRTTQSPKAAAKTTTSERLRKPADIAKTRKELEALKRDLLSGKTVESTTYETKLKSLPKPEQRELLNKLLPELRKSEARLDLKSLVQYFKTLPSR